MLAAHICFTCLTRFSFSLKQNPYFCSRIATMAKQNAALGVPISPNSRDNTVNSLPAGGNVTGSSSSGHVHGQSKGEHAAQGNGEIVAQQSLVFHTPGPAVPSTVNANMAPSDSAAGAAPASSLPALVLPSAEGFKVGLPNSHVQQELAAPSRFSNTTDHSAAMMSAIAAAAPLPQTSFQTPTLGTATLAAAPSLSLPSSAAISSFSGAAHDMSCGIDGSVVDADVSKLSAVIVQLKKELSEKEIDLVEQQGRNRRERRDMDDDISTLRARLRDRDAATLSLRQDIEGLQQTCSSKDEEIHNLKVRLNDNELHTNILKRNLEEKGTKVDELQSQIEKLNKEMMSALPGQEETEKLLSDLQAQQKRIHLLEDERKQVDNQLKKLSDELSDKNDDISQLSTKVQAHAETEATIRKSLDEVQAQLQEATAKATESTKNSTEKTETLEKLEATHASLQNQLETEKQDHDSLKNEHATLKQTSHLMHEQCQQIGEDNAMLNQNLTTMTARCAEMDREREGLINALEEKSKQLMQVSEAVMRSEAKDSEILRLKEECSSLQASSNASSSELQNQVGALIESNTKLQEEVASLTNRCAGLQSAMGAAKEESSLIRDESREKDVQIKELELFQAELASENDELRSQVDSLKELRIRDAQVMEEEIARHRESQMNAPARASSDQSSHDCNADNVMEDSAATSESICDDMDKYFLNESSLHRSRVSEGAEMESNGT